MGSTIPAGLDEALFQDASMPTFANEMMSLMLTVC